MAEEKAGVAVFFSLGVGIEDWRRQGLLQRYLPYFRKLKEEFGGLYLFTYDRSLCAIDEEGMRICPMPFRIPNLVYAFLMPFFYLGLLSKALLFVTVQTSGAIPALPAKLLARKPLFLSCGYSWLSFSRYAKEPRLRVLAVDLIERLAFTFSDAIVVTEKSQAAIAARFNKPERIFVMPNSVDIERFKPYQGKKQDKIVFIGRFTEQKNIFPLIEAVSGLNDIELDLIGGGKLEVPLRAFALKLGARVNFLGNLENDVIAKQLPRYKALALPSLYEGDPKVAIEAMAAGTPVVASKVAGTRDLITDKVTGIFCGLDTNSVRESLRCLLEDEALASRIAENARNYVASTRELNADIAKKIKIMKGLLK